RVFIGRDSGRLVGARIVRSGLVGSLGRFGGGLGGLDGLVLGRAGERLGGFRAFGGLHGVVAAVAASAATPATAIAASALFAVRVLVLGFFRFGAQQRLPVGDGDLVVVGMYFTEGEEAVTVPAIFDEGSLERRFYAGYPRQI